MDPATVWDARPLPRLGFSGTVAPRARRTTDFPVARWRLRPTPTVRRMSLPTRKWVQNSDQRRWLWLEGEGGGLFIRLVKGKENTAGEQLIGCRMKVSGQEGFLTIQNSNSGEKSKKQKGNHGKEFHV
ncbi:hypothetical protein L6452_15231 [Arctium lappa]|uniref:Uncharacterized protein n=1 Tax=Arctium lappa TaxID=4217 RepID=A0ACB9CN67_ARCLA|nr:hypothetical protein L6452_15231 [Arctium lappa]